MVACSAKKEASQSNSTITLGPSDSDVVLVMGDEKISEKEFMANMPAALKGEFAKAQQQYIDAKQAAVAQFAFDRLLKKEAEATGVSEEELLKKEIDAKTKDVSDEQVKSFYQDAAKRYEQAGREAPELNDQVKEQIRGSLVAQQQAERQQAYLDELFAKYNVSIVLPEAVRFDVAKGTLPAKGKENAKVTIVEFSDYHCPFCKRGSDNIKEVMDKYGDKIEYRFRDMPLEQIHPRAKAAALAARCANDQNEFWAYHDKVFNNQGKKTDEDFVAFAKDLGLKVEDFKACYDEKRHLAAVEQDMADARSLGLSGTPAYFINGVLMSGAVPPEQIIEVIEKQL
jgi:protein-disulfide isomerase